MCAARRDRKIIHNSGNDFVNGLLHVVNIFFSYPSGNAALPFEFFRRSIDHVNVQCTFRVLIYSCVDRFRAALVVEQIVRSTVFGCEMGQLTILCQTIDWALTNPNERAKCGRCIKLWVGQCFIENA